MSEENNYDYKAIDAVVNIWTREALSQRPDWGDDFFVGKMNAKDSLMTGLSLDEMLERMETAGIDKAFLIAAHAGRVGMPGCYHMPYEIVARACEEYPDRFYGLAGIDPFDGMEGVRALKMQCKTWASSVLIYIRTGMNWHRIMRSTILFMQNVVSSMSPFKCKWVNRWSTQKNIAQEVLDNPSHSMQWLVICQN